MTPDALQAREKCRGAPTEVIISAINRLDIALARQKLYHILVYQRVVRELLEYTSKRRRKPTDVDIAFDVERVEIDQIFSRCFKVGPVEGAGSF
jgi:tRNA nucleotidyltransferase/poly(A) polymerase